MATNVNSVTNHFPSAQNNFVTSLNGSISAGASTVPLNSVAGYTNSQTVVMVIDPTVVGKQQAFTGTINTSTVSVDGVVWTAGANVAHDGGAVVVDYATATHVSMISKGILVGHNQTGTHKAFTESNIVPSVAIQDSAVATAKLADGAVTGAKITNYKVVRQNDTSNTTETAARILTGWGLIAYNTGANIAAETVTFNSAFTSPPIVVVTFGGDSVAGTTYGSGGNTVEARVYAKAHTITATTFIVNLHKESGANFQTGNGFYQWMAIGT